MTGNRDRLSLVSSGGRIAEIPPLAVLGIGMTVNGDRLSLVSSGGGVAEIPPLAMLGIGMTVNGDELLLDSRRLAEAPSTLIKIQQR